MSVPGRVIWVRYILRSNRRTLQFAQVGYTSELPLEIALFPLGTDDRPDKIKLNDSLWCLVLPVYPNSRTVIDIWK